jgi:hypothetical protein
MIKILSIGILKGSNILVTGVRMGLYTKIEERLPEQFSILQVMKILQMDEKDFSECRNILKQWHQQGLIKRISKNMYQKI